MTKTEEQRRQFNEWRKEYRKQKKERGECRDCKEPIYKGGRCEKHYVEMRQGVNKLYDKKRESGVCIYCEKPAYKGGRCERHYAELLGIINSYSATIREHFGNACNRCGATANLHIHHRNFDGKEHRAKFGNSLGTYLDIIERGFPEDEVEILCNCCHREVHREHRAKQRQMAQAAD